MSLVALPTAPAIQSAKPFVQSFGGVLIPFLGGPTQRIVRLGTRWGVTIRMATMEAEPHGRQWVSALAQGQENGVIMNWPHDVAVGMPGAPSVAAAVQGGTLALPIKGLTAGYSLKDGQFLSIMHAGRRYLYVCTDSVIAAGDGTATAGIWPMLRTALSADDAIEIAQPKIEGWLSGQFDWDVLRMPFVQLPEFTVTERA